MKRQKPSPVIRATRKPNPDLQAMADSLYDRWLATPRADKTWKLATRLRDRGMMPAAEDVLLERLNDWLDEVDMPDLTGGQQSAIYTLVEEHALGGLS